MAALALGWFLGAVAGGTVSAGAGVCDVEPAWHGNGSGEIKYDHTDGEDEVNQWYAAGGQDYLRSEACDDIDVHGEDQNDDVGGGSADDNVWGEAGRDTVYGGAGDDHLYGGSGDDDFFDAETADYDRGQGSTDDDTIDFLDGDGNDYLDGGAGTDNCKGNTGDYETSDCES
ncbi:MAG: calcium-binding protein [Actinomycetota bacterium]